jgi:uncharacterized protein YdhG (YjbR/CyaY superfamily)
MRETKKFESVADYFEAQTEAAKGALMELRECILKAVPDAVELFNYDIPAYALVEGGKREQQAMIAGYKKHV